MDVAPVTKEKAFLNLIEKHKRIIYKVCRVYVQDEEDRNDLFQEIVLQLWLSYDSFRRESSFSTWMYRVGGA